MTLTVPDELADFRARRRTEANGPRGAAAFFWGDFVTAPGARVPGAPGRWEPLPDGRAGLRVRASADEGLRIGGELVDGDAVLHYDESDGPTVARFADGAEGVIFSYDRSKYALQVWNPRSEWAARFADISVFDWDPGWRVPASVLPVEPGRTLAISHHRDPRPVDVPVAAEVVFAHDGVQHRLAATQAPGSEGLFVNFTDATNGAESYAAGRGLRFTPAADGTVVLDFNYTTLLPCAFSLAWNCPIPAAENRLAVPVRAGERNAVDADGRILL